MLEIKKRVLPVAPIVAFWSLILTGCDNLSDSFFKKLFQDEMATASRICHHNPPLLSDGDFFEIYRLSEPVLNSLRSKIEADSIVSFPSKETMDPYGNFDSYIPWTKCSSDNEKVREVQRWLSDQDSEMECYSIDELDKVMGNKSNYFSLFYNSENGKVVGCQLYVIDVDLQRLLFVSIMIM